MIRLIKAGEWASYGDVADVVGTVPMALGSHIRSCEASEEAPEWRVLNDRGGSSPGFMWTSDGYHGSQVDHLISEGLAFIDGHRANPARRVRATELRTRLKPE